MPQVVADIAQELLVGGAVVLIVLVTVQEHVLELVQGALVDVEIMFVVETALQIANIPHVMKLVEVHALTAVLILVLATVMISA